MNVNELEPHDQGLLMLARIDQLREAVDNNPGSCPKKEVKELAELFNALYCEGRAVPMLKIVVESS